jgi:hypothetical protein
VGKTVLGEAAKSLFQKREKAVIFVGEGESGHI